MIPKEYTWLLMNPEIENQWFDAITQHFYFSVSDQSAAFVQLRKTLVSRKSELQEGNGREKNRSA
jgi:hypothetical protein